MYGESLNLQVKFVPLIDEMYPTPDPNQHGMMVPAPELKPKFNEKTSLFASSLVGNPMKILP